MYNIMDISNLPMKRQTSGLKFKKAKLMERCH